VARGRAKLEVMVSIIPSHANSIRCGNLFHKKYLRAKSENDGASLSHRARFAFLAVIYLAKKCLCARSRAKSVHTCAICILRGKSILRKKCWHTKSRDLFSPPPSIPQKSVHARDAYFLW